MHFKEIQGSDWLALAICFAVLALIFIMSKPPWPPLGSVRVGPHREPPREPDNTWHLALLLGAIMACLLALAVWGFMP